MAFIFTCEHGGNRIPRQYRLLFEGKTRLLQSHRGWDQGALQLARSCARSCSAPLYYSEVSRLLIDLNRSLHHRGLYSGITSGIDAKEKQRILDNYYFPYRERVETTIRDQIRRPVIHLSVHSFTPALNGVVRNSDVGLLYDPSRKQEQDFCLRLQAQLKRAFPRIMVRRNYPYLGTADGFTTYLRSRFPAGVYLGIEIEINQKHISRESHIWRRMLKEFGAVLSSICPPG